MAFICFVCGYDGLREPPGMPTFEKCPSCAYEFGHMDFLEGGFYDAYRREWIEDGMPWRRPDDPFRKEPPNWNPTTQLTNLNRLDRDRLQEAIQGVQRVRQQLGLDEPHK